MSILEFSSYFPFFSNFTLLQELIVDFGGQSGSHLHDFQVSIRRHGTIGLNVGLILQNQSYEQIHHQDIK